jgi:hypothetical protein
VAGQVHQFAADLQGGQPAELAGRRRPDAFERPPQAEQGVLQHVIGLLPAAHAGVVAQHHPDEPAQPVARQREQLVARGLLALRPALQAALDLRGDRDLRHA